MKFIAISALAFMACAFTGTAQTILQPHSTYLQNFDSMGTSLSLPQNWRIRYDDATPTWSESLTTVDYEFSGDTPTATGTYNWSSGDGLDRAVGVMRANGTNLTALTGYFRIEDSINISSITLTFDGEQYLKKNDDLILNVYFGFDGVTWNLISSTQPFFAGIGSPTTKTRTLDIPLDLSSPSDFYIQFRISTGRQAVGIDNIMVTPVPEPQIFIYFIIAAAVFLAAHKSRTRRCS